MDKNTNRFVQTLKALLKPSALKASEKEGCLFIEVQPRDLVKICSACVSRGLTFDSAFASPAARREFTVRYLFVAPEIHRMVVIASTGREFGALSERLNAAVWDERKIQDQTGLKFADMPDNRPLIFHQESGFPAEHPIGGARLKKPNHEPYLMPGTGEEGEFEIAVGPVHAGIIEPGHFRFHVVGERINKMETRMFFLHRGIEKMAEGENAEDILPLIEKISGDEVVANSVAYCQAVERAYGISVPRRAQTIRSVFMELERIYSHLADLGGMATDVGFNLASSRFSVLREDMMRLNNALFKTRFLHGSCVVGGAGKDINAWQASTLRHALGDMLYNLDQLEHMAFTSATFLDRAYTTGTVRRTTAKDLALVGPAARACGIHCDLRGLLPYAAYGSMVFNESLETEGGDVLSRFRVKSAEIEESARLISALLSTLTPGPIRAKQRAVTRGGIGVGWAEAPRGGCTFLVEISKKGTITRLAFRTASFRNWRALEKAVLGNIVPDFPLINKSFNLSYAGTDG
jgi:Ni,Fe-hydrogenase III large subunit